MPSFNLEKALDVADILLSGDKAPFIQSYDKNLAAGMAMKSTDYKVTFLGYDHLSVVVQTAQTPTMQREPIETFGSMGVKFTQAGHPILGGEISMTLKEVLDARVYQTLRHFVREGEYVDLDVELIGKQERPVSDHIFKLRDCIIQTDSGDLDVSAAGVLMVPITVIYNRFEP